jgi:glycosyltransferase involved in cell wall biosynthesis
VRLSMAIVHEWFSATGGSEIVFRHIAGIVPHAARFVLWREPDVLDDFSVRESWLARTPLRRAKALALPVMPLVWRTLSRERFDVVLSSSHAFAHTVKLGSDDGTRYLSYVHTPARYLWSPAYDGRGDARSLALPRRALRAVDLRLSRHVHSYAANSREVAQRIRRYWHRDAEVIHPPVDVDYFGAPVPAGPSNRDYLLAVGRWVRYKNIALTIAIAAEAGWPLVIAGSGPDEARLRAAAATVDIPVTFEVRPGRERLRELYRGARALLFPTHEDFGIIPVEAQASGTPVVGLRRGGLLETVSEGETGFLVDSLQARDYLPALARLDELRSEDIQRNARRFDHATFAHRMGAWIHRESAA